MQWSGNSRKPFPARLTMRYENTRMWLCLVLCVFGILSGNAASAQSAQRPSETQPMFEVASVKPNKSVDGRGALINLAQPGRITISKFTLRMVIAQAYDLPNLSDAFN